jgi:hypothetical protein
MTPLPVLRSKELNNSVCGTSQYLCKTKEYNDISWLLLKLLDKETTEKDDLRVYTSHQAPTNGP